MILLGLSLAGAVAAWLVLLWITRRDSAVVVEVRETELGAAMRRLTAAFLELEVSIGQALAPAVTDAATAMRRLVEAFAALGRL